MSTHDDAIQLKLWEDYTPEVNDYVVWNRGEYGIDKGWVYFKCEEYITIETGIKPKPHCKYSRNNHHKNIHTLLLCQSNHWHQLQYVKKRTPREQIEHYSQCDD